jgi:hypothetical protein
LSFSSLALTFSLLSPLAILAMSAPMESAFAWGVTVGLVAATSIFAVWQRKDALLKRADARDNAASSITSDMNQNNSRNKQPKKSRSPRASQDETDNASEEDRLLFEWYSQRRLHDRLSFNDMDYNAKEDDAHQARNDNLVSKSANNETKQRKNKTINNNKQESDSSSLSSQSSTHSSVENENENEPYQRHRRSNRKLSRKHHRPTNLVKTVLNRTADSGEDVSMDSSIPDYNSTFLNNNSDNNNNWNHFEQYTEAGKRRSQYLMRQHSTFMSLGGDHRPNVNDHADELSDEDVKSFTRQSPRSSESENINEPDCFGDRFMVSDMHGISATPRPAAFTMMPSIPSERVLECLQDESSSLLHSAPPTPPRHSRLLKSTEAKEALTLHKSVSFDQLSMPIKKRPKSAIKQSTIDQASRRQVLSKFESDIEDQSQRHLEARTCYNSRIMPHQVILVRHGQSMGNLDEGLYSTTPDNAMPLTKLGFEQGREAGRMIRGQLLVTGRLDTDKSRVAIRGGRTPPVHFIVSPYVRTVETMHGKSRC